MTEDNDKLARRIAGICNAKPAISGPPQPRRIVQSEERPERETVFRLASIYTGKNAFIRCVVKDVSDNGARLTLKTAQILAEIIVVKFDQNGVRKRMRVVWQDGYEIGVEDSDDQTLIDSVCPPGAPVKADR